jgi:hypothetical protein
MSRLKPIEFAELPTHVLRQIIEIAAGEDNLVDSQVALYFQNVFVPALDEDQSALARNVIQSYHASRAKKSAKENMEQLHARDAKPPLMDLRRVTSVTLETDEDEPPVRTGFIDSSLLNRSSTNPHESASLRVQQAELEPVRLDFDTPVKIKRRNTKPPSRARTSAEDVRTFAQMQERHDRSKSLRDEYISNAFLIESMHARQSEILKTIKEFDA